MPKFKDFESFQTVHQFAHKKNQAIDFFPGTKLQEGRFQIRGLIGGGGMGAVYLAEDHHHHCQVALKVMLPEFMQEEKARSRFRNEVTIAQSLNHPNIIQTYDLYKEGELLFFTMEYVDGPSLRDFVEKLKRDQSLIDPIQVVRWGQEICRGLSFAHKTTIHRDIKPDNILLLPQGQGFSVKITDFGLACLSVSSQVSYSSVVLGTLPYMAPEQMTPGAKLDYKLDLYALGVILYELLTGYFPKGRFSLPSELNPHFSPKWDSLIQKALAQKVEDRFTSAEAMEKALGEILEKADPRETWKKNLQEFVHRQKGSWTYEEYQALIDVLMKSHSLKQPCLSELVIAQELEIIRQEYLRGKQHFFHEQNKKWQMKMRDNLARVQASGLLMEFVKKEEGKWTDESQQELKENLQKQGFYPLQEDSLKNILEEEKNLYWAEEERNKKNREYLLMLEKSYQHKEALEFISFLRENEHPQPDMLLLMSKIEIKHKEITRQWTSVRAAKKRQDWDEARESLERILEVHPLSGEAQKELSLVSRQKSQEAQEKENQIFEREKKYIDQMIKEKEWEKSLLSLDELEKKSQTWKYQNSSVEQTIKLLYDQIEREKICENWEEQEMADFTEHSIPGLAKLYQERYAEKYGYPVEISVSLEYEQEILFRLIPPGYCYGKKAQERALLGSKSPFYLAAYLVTQSQWESVLGEQPMVWKGPCRPVERIQWRESLEFIKRLKTLTGKNVDLAEEEEWEYACRGGSNEDYFFGSSPDSLSQYAWFLDNSKGRTHNVGEKKANEWGIYDTLGHLWEWCYPAKERKTEKKICRGGNLFSSPQECQCSSFREFSSSDSHHLSGLRIILREFP